MKELKIFYLNGCPYCRMGKRAYEELLKENAVYGNIQTEWIEENASPEIAGSYDYYYVPSIFCGKEKLFECNPKYDYEKIKEGFRKAFESISQ